MLARLSQEPDWKVAIASGSWKAAAKLKLRAAGINPEQFPSAFADDGFSREEILKAAIVNAQHQYQLEDFDSVVSIGDGVWDVRTARNLSFPFLGIGVGDGADRLRQEGAEQVLKDLADYQEVLRVWPP
jgi:phosphoglycolate phosphatase-like HAD superfamily hydrolase